MSLPKKKSTRASILVMSIFFMLILFITASAFLVLLPTESRAAQRTEHQSVGALVADAGVSQSISWLREQLSPRNGSASREPMASGVYPNLANRTVQMNSNWTYRWELIPDTQTFPNGSNPIRAFTVVSRAYHRGKAVREARAEIIQQSLAEYAALYDNWPKNLVMGISSDSAPAGGPVHVNDILNLWIRDGASFWSSTGAPRFSHGLRASGVKSGSQDGFAYYQGNYSGSDANKIPYNSGGPISARYNRLATGGRDSMVAGAAKVNLPQNTFALSDAAWGFNSPTPKPSSNGVYLNQVNGKVQGIYIRGTVEEMELGVGGTQPAGSGTVNYGQNSWVKIEQPGTATNSITNNRNWTVVTIKESSVVLPAGSVVNGATLTSPTTYNAGTTLKRNPNGTFEHYNSELNGVVYGTSHINDLWGVNKGRRTIAVESDLATNTRNSIIIGGKENDSNGSFSIAAGEKGLIQFGATDSDGDGILDPPATADNVLGLVARDVMVSSKLKHNSNWASSHPASNPLYIFAVVLGGINGDGGTYGVESYDSGGAGYAYKYGSRIVVDGGAWGTTSGHGLVEGNSFYDPKAAQSPPPYFPSNPTFVVKSYEDRPGRGELL